RRRTRRVAECDCRRLRGHDRLYRPRYPSLDSIGARRVTQRPDPCECTCRRHALSNLGHRRAGGDRAARAACRRHHGVLRRTRLHVFALPRCAEACVMALVVRDVQIVRGGRTLLDNISLTLERGEVVGLLGPNGAGKTTLLRAISGEDLPDRGTIEYDGVCTRT